MTAVTRLVIADLIVCILLKLRLWLIIIQYEIWCVSAWRSWILLLNCLRRLWKCLILITIWGLRLIQCWIWLLILVGSWLIKIRCGLILVRSWLILISHRLILIRSGLINVLLIVGCLCWLWILVLLDWLRILVLLLCRLTTTWLIGLTICLSRMSLRLSRL